MGARRVGMSALGAVAIVTFILPASAAVGTDAPGGELSITRDQLAGAARELSEVEASVQRTNDEVAATDERLRAATTARAQVLAELVLAEAARDEAMAAERHAAAALFEIDVQLDTSLEEWAARRTLMQRRAVHAFKHGSTITHDVLVRGVVNAGDWHEVAVTLEVVGRIAAEDADLLDGSAALTLSTAELRSRAGTARAEARSTALAARTRERRVAELATRHERIVADIETEHARRAAVLADLESDAAARAVLVRDLERRVRELEFAAITVLVPIDVDLDVYGPPPAWADRLPDAGATYAAAIEATASRYGIDGRLLAALVWTESGFRADAVSHAGALGLAQLMPGTARSLRVDPRDPLQNLDGGARYLRSQIDRFGSADLALAAYNAGPGRVQRSGNRIPDIVETQLYVVRVLDRYRKLSA